MQCLLPSAQIQTAERAERAERAEGNRSGCACNPFKLEDGVLDDQPAICQQIDTGVPRCCSTLTAETCSHAISSHPCPCAQHLVYFSQIQAHASLDMPGTANMYLGGLSDDLSPMPTCGSLATMMEAKMGFNSNATRLGLWSCLEMKKLSTRAPHDANAATASG